MELILIYSRESLLSNSADAEFLGIEHEIRRILIERGIIGQSDHSDDFAVFSAYFYSITEFELIALHVKAVESDIVLAFGHIALEEAYLIHLVPDLENADLASVNRPEVSVEILIELYILFLEGSYHIAVRLHGEL